MLNDALCSAPKQNVLETSVAVRGRDDQISRKFLCEFADFMKWSCACSAGAFVPAEIIRLFRDALSDVQPIACFRCSSNDSGKYPDGQHRSHEIGRDTASDERARDEWRRQTVGRDVSPFRLPESTSSRNRSARECFECSVFPWSFYELVAGSALVIDCEN